MTATHAPVNAILPPNKTGCRQFVMVRRRKDGYSGRSKREEERRSGCVRMQSFLAERTPEKGPHFVLFCTGYCHSTVGEEAEKKRAETAAGTTRRAGGEKFR